jgi:hypothetical protein
VGDLASETTPRVYTDKPCVSTVCTSDTLGEQGEEFPFRLRPVRLNKRIYITDQSKTLSRQWQRGKGLDISDTISPSEGNSST